VFLSSCLSFPPGPLLPHSKRLCAFTLFLSPVFLFCLRPRGPVLTPLSRFPSTTSSIYAFCVPRVFFRHGPRPFFWICLLFVARVVLQASYPTTRFVFLLPNVFSRPPFPFLKNDRSLASILPTALFSPSRARSPTFLFRGSL